MYRLIMLLAIVGLGASFTVRADDTFGASGGPAAAQVFTLGSLRLVALHDAQLVVHNDGTVFGVDVGPGPVSELLRAYGLPEDRITLSINALLVRTGHRVILIDSGIGAKANGSLLASLKVAGIPPNAVTDVAITHSHGDHLGGLIDANGNLAFPNSTIRMATAEWTWLKSQRTSAQLVKAIGHRVEAFTPGTPIAPGVTPIALDGHTPGHVGYEIVSGRHRLLDIGDLAHSSLLSLKKPGWTMGFDSDSTLAKATRKATLARIARDHELIFAPHFPFPGVGHIVTDGDAYTWIPGLP
jgi:glyoxylase-like metal-dependent hydrolase (beta-lactamase superfamily II)